MNAVLLPLTEEWVVAEMVGKKLSVGINNLPTPDVEIMGFAILGDGGSMESDVASKWEVTDSVLELQDERGKVIYRFSGALASNGSLFLSGDSLRDASLNGFTRTIMYPFVSVGDNFGVLVSSHADYYQNGPVDLLITSLIRHGISEERIRVVVAGSRDDSEEEQPGHLHIEGNHFGFSGLSGLDDSYPYWMLLHDTCEVMGDFKEKSSLIDVGLNYDSILFTPEKHNGVGLYRTDFVNEINWSEVRGDRLFDHIKNSSKLRMLLGGRANSGMASQGKRDVYGNGTLRKVFYLESIGIKKYSSDSLTVKAP